MIANGSVATLAGVLSGFALADVLQLLELGARSGTLVVDGGPLGHGAIQLSAGRVVAVSEGASRATTADAQIASIGRMLDWCAGRWTFQAGEELGLPNAAAGLAITTILVDGARRRDEIARRALHEPRPRADVPVLADGGASEDGGACERLTAADLNVLAAVDGSRDVQALAAITRRDAALVAASIARLRALGVLRTETPPMVPVA